MSDSTNLAILEIMSFRQFIFTAILFHLIPTNLARAETRKAMPNPVTAKPEITGPITNPFPALKPGMVILGKDLVKAIGGKFTMRLLLDGGPISQPPDFFTIQPNPKWMDDIRELSGYIDNRSARKRFIDPARRLNVESVIEQLASLKQSILFKPESSTLGNGVAFFDGSTNDHLTVTMALQRGDNSGYKQRQSCIQSVAEKMGTAHERIILNKDIIQLKLNRNHSQIRQFLSAILFHLTTIPEWKLYDSGMIETAMPFAQFEHGVYETRYAFRGNLLTGEMEPLEQSELDREPNPGSIGRIGSSAFFANQTERLGSVRTISKEFMLEPLRDLFAIPKERYDDFRRHVDQLIVKEFQYAAARLHAAGIEANKLILGQFDLGWLAPLIPGGFPVPMIVEANFLDSYLQVLQDSYFIKATTNQH